MTNATSTALRTSERKVTSLRCDAARSLNLCRCCSDLDPGANATLASAPPSTKTRSGARGCFPGNRLETLASSLESPFRLRPLCRGDSLGPVAPELVDRFNAPQGALPGDADRLVVDEDVHRVGVHLREMP